MRNFQKIFSTYLFSFFIFSCGEKEEFDSWEKHGYTHISSPSDLTATGSSELVTLDWTTVNSAKNYTLYWGNSTGVNSSSTAITSINTDNYSHTGLDNGTTYFHFTLEKLNGSTSTQTTTVSPGASNPSAGAWYVSTAQATMNEIMSHIFVLTGNDATKNSVVRDWMVAKYTGAGIEQQVGTYTYNLEKEQRIEFKQHCQTVSKIDFRFRDETGKLLCPTRGIVKLNFRV